MPWSVIDFQVLRQQLVIAAGSNTNLPQINFPQVPLSQLWRIEGVAIAMLVPSNYAYLYEVSPPQVFLYDQPVGPSVCPCQGTTLASCPTIDPSQGAYDYWADFDDQGSPLTIRGGDALTVLFNAQPPVGTIFLVRIQYEVLAGVAGAPGPIGSV